MKKFFKRNTNTGERDRKKKEEEVSSSLQKNHEQDSSTAILHNGQKKASERLLLDPRGMMMKRKTTTTTIATTKSSSSPPIILDANVVMVTPAAAAAAAASSSKAETKQHFMADYTIESQRNLTLSNNSNSSSSSQSPPSDNDKLIKQRLKEERMQQEERMQYWKKISEGSNNSNNSYYNGQLPLSQRGLSREEQDKLTKEIIKQQRAAAASSLSSSVSYTSSTITVGHRSTLPAAAQEEASIEESSHSISSSNTSSSSSSSSSDDSDKGSISFSWRSNTDLMSSSLKSNDNNKNDDDDEQLLDVSSSDGMMMKKEGSGRSIKSVLKGKQRYTSGDRGGEDGDGKKNLDGGREESWKSVSFAKNLHIDDDDDDDEGRRSSSRVSYDLAKDDDDDDGEDGNKARPKVDDLNESDFNIDDWNDAIMASAREFDGPDHHYDEYDNEELRRSNLIDLHIAQFIATSQISGSLDFDPSELKEIYRNSIDGVEEGEEDDDDDEEQQMYRDASRRQLAHFEEEEFKKNMRRRMSQRLSKTSLRIAAWHQKHSLRMAMKVATRTPAMEWLSSFYRCDPRWQIQAFFDEVAREGGDAQLSEDLAASPLALLFNKANVFTVWRPTSDEAIKNMMLGIATGKGLDIKGKSAKRGNISSYVPFIQIYEEEHKAHVRELLKDGRTIRVFYQSEASRDEAHGMISDMKEFMLFAAEDAMRILSDEFADEAEQELAMKHLMYDDSNVRVTLVDTYVESDTLVFGLDITERLFWESYVMMQDCSRSEGTEWDIGRKSEPTFMDFNFKSLRKDPGPDAPRAVVYQFSKDSPMEPRTLLMAYEEHGMVKPVVSDFDCFLLGSRGVKYSQQIPPDQVELVKWSVTNISEVLDERAATQSDSGWMSNWFQVLKKAAMRNYVPITPKYGNGDPKSYEIIEIAVSRLKGTGCVRHGAECFNWYFPQEIDDEFLVISDTLPGHVKWKKMNVFELQECLMTKIDEGFTFPINPKWVLCDPGWRRVYDKLLASQKPNVQDSINCWLPPETGLREQIDAISKRHPHGFEGRVYKVEGTEVMDKMEEELERYRRVQALWRKARALVWWIVFLHTKSQMKRLEAFQQRR